MKLVLGTVIRPKGGVRGRVGVGGSGNSCHIEQLQSSRPHEILPVRNECLADGYILAGMAPVFVLPVSSEHSRLPTISIAFVVSILVYLQDILDTHHIPSWLPPTAQSPTGP